MKFFAILFLLFILFACIPKSPQEIAREALSQQAKEEVVQKAAKGQYVASVGEIVRSGYFDVTVNGITGGDRVNVGNPFLDLKPEQGIGYLVLDVTFKNIDNQDQMLFDGTLFFRKDGQEYKINQSVTVMAEGYGIMLNNVSPLTGKRTKIVYKLPSDLVGEIFWLPYGGNTWIHVANINPKAQIQK